MRERAQGIGAADGALISYASRLGRDGAIRQTTAQEDVEWRARHSRRLLEVLARTNVYYRAYEPMTLDSWAEAERWRPTVVALPAYPPQRPAEQVARPADQAPILRGD